MGYIQSGNIHVFPAANRGANFPYSRITTEYNLTQNLRAFTSHDGFVAMNEDEMAGLNANTIIKFVIHGYYFEASASDIIEAATPNNGDTVYAKITLAGLYDNQNNTLELQSQTNPGDPLDNYEENGYFTGVSFINTPPSNLNIEDFYIPLFDYVNNNAYNIPLSYRTRLAFNEVDCVWINLDS